MIHLKSEAERATKVPDQPENRYLSSIPTMQFQEYGLLIIRDNTLRIDS